jgi:SAM-dependent methyltransferase
MLSRSDGEMDLHDFDIVAEHYDSYVVALTGKERQKEFADFHLGLAQAFGQDGVLDIACGTGRIAIPLIKAGHTVFAFDISEAMIGRFRAKLEELDPQVRHRAHISVQNMIDFTYDRTFSVAMIPCSGFMHLLTPGDQRRALSNINKHLEMEGVLSFNTFDPDMRRIAGSGDGAGKWRKRTELATAGGHVMEIYDRMSYDLAHQTMQGMWRFVEYDEERRLLRETEVPLRMRYTFRQEMRYLLELTGFRVDELYGSYGKSYPRYPSTLVWIARKAMDVGTAQR